jgi:hypothetical protein
MDKTVSNVFENVTEAHRKAVDALMGFNKIAVRTQGLLAGQQLAALENVFDAGSKNLQLVSEARDPRDLMASQTEVAVQLWTSRARPATKSPRWSRMASRPLTSPR